MSRLKNKKIILGISGSIAAYKTPQLVRLLVKEGADVQTILTKGGEQFVTPLSLSTVSGNPTLTAISEDNQWNNHVILGRDADLMLVAPCSANTLAKLSNGLCDNVLEAVYLSATCPMYIAPAMDVDMWHHPTTQNNVATLKNHGCHIVPVGKGFLASGLIGEGRMAEPEDIVELIVAHFQKDHQDLRKALVTAGPTYEAIDPVRFIGNHSTGKMGVAIAQSLANKDFKVDLVAGPGVQHPDHPLITTHSVTSALEMQKSCLQFFENADITVMAAAVADYRPSNAANEKIKKDPSNKNLNIELIQNPDIIAGLGKIKKEHQILVGFALETNNEEENALKKLKAKNADYIVLNSLKEEGAGFGTDTNKVTILSQKGEKYPLPLLSKQEVADKIIEKVLS